MSQYDTVYFLGIGGIGMSALARWFNRQGMFVAGYDRTPTPLTKELEKEGIKIHFEDDGPGIPARNIPYIFELFFGAGKLSAGLGLTYCRRVLKNMNASIHLTSKPDSGVTEFTISF